MPTFTLDTNVPSDKVPADFLKTTSALVASTLGKPESYVCIHLRADQRLLSFGGTTAPCGYGVLMSIGKLGAEANKTHSAKLFKHLQDTLGIPPDRLSRTKMPILSFVTNLSKLPPGFLEKTGKLVSQLTNKAEERVFSHALTNQTVRFDNSEDKPMIYLHFQQIGHDHNLNNKFSDILCKHMNAELNIPVNRVYIKFETLIGQQIGWNCTTKGDIK